VYDNNIINEHMGWKRIGFSKWLIKAHLTRAILNDFASAEHVGTTPEHCYGSINQKAYRLFPVLSLMRPENYR
jgi:hypothetical protein